MATFDSGRQRDSMNFYASHQRSLRVRLGSESQVHIISAFALEADPSALLARVSVGFGQVSPSYGDDGVMSHSLPPMTPPSA
jgi:hypothetical protein